ncbi:unnamed protein product [Laminaria digitata]
MGCCSCCWVEDPSPGGGVGGHPRLSVSRCRGCCAERCRAPDRRRQPLGGVSTQVAGGRRAPPFPAGGRQTTAFPGSAEARSGASLACPSWGVAHTHLFRLVAAIDDDSLANQGAPLAPAPTPPPASAPASRPALAPGVAAKQKPIGGGDGGSGSGGGGGGGGVTRPRACRFGSSNSSTARRNPRLLSLLAGLLCLDPDERLTPLQALAHPFFDEVLPFALPTATAERSIKVKSEPTQAAPALPESPCPLSTRTSPAEKIMELGHGCEKQGRPLGGVRATTFWGTALEGTPTLAQSVAAAATTTTAATASTATTAAVVATGVYKQPDSSNHRFNGGMDAEPRAYDRESAPTLRGLNRGRSKVTRPALRIFTSRPSSAVQSRPEAAACRVGNPTTPSSSAWGPELGELDPTAQLRRLAETAEEMVGKGNRSSRVGGDGGSATSSGSSSGSGSGSSSGGGRGSSIGVSDVTLPSPPPPLPPPTPRRNSFMGAIPSTTPELAGSRGEAKSAPDVSTLCRTSTEQQQQQQQPNAVSRVPPAAPRAPGHAGGTAHTSGATTIAFRRRRNRFLTPATLAKLNHDLMERGARAAAGGAGAGVTTEVVPPAIAVVAEAAAASCWSTRTKPESTPAKHPRKRPLLDTSPGGDPPGMARKVAKTVAAAAVATAATREAEDFQLFEPHRSSPGTEEDTTSSKTSEEAGGCTYAAVDRGEWANVNARAAGAGRKTPPRRAAVAAGVALSRLRREDSDSDSSLTL